MKKGSGGRGQGRGGVEGIIYFGGVAGGGRMFEFSSFRRVLEDSTASTQIIEGSLTADDELL